MLYQSSDCRSTFLFQAYSLLSEPFFKLKVRKKMIQILVHKTMHRGKEKEIEQNQFPQEPGKARPSSVMARASHLGRSERGSRPTVTKMSPTLRRE